MNQRTPSTHKPERFRVWRFRRWATAAAVGRVLEIGSGPGRNLAHYPRRVSEVVPFDPDGDSLARIDRRGRRAHAVRARAEWLPFPDASFDSAVGTLVFCTVAAPLMGLREVYRVLKPGTRLRLVEHVSSSNPALAAFQHVATPGWKQIAFGCHLDRNTVATVQRAGFEVRCFQPRLLGTFVAIEAVRN